MVTTSTAQQPLKKRKFSELSPKPMSLRDHPDSPPLKRACLAEEPLYPMSEEKKRAARHAEASEQRMKDRFVRAQKMKELQESLKGRTLSTQERDGRIYKLLSDLYEEEQVLSEKLIDRQCDEDYRIRLRCGDLALDAKHNEYVQQAEEKHKSNALALETAEKKLADAEEGRQALRESSSAKIKQLEDQVTAEVQERKKMTIEAEKFNAMSARLQQLEEELEANQRKVEAFDEMNGKIQELEDEVKVKQDALKVKSEECDALKSNGAGAAATLSNALKDEETLHRDAEACVEGLISEARRELDKKDTSIEELKGQLARSEARNKELLSEKQTIIAKLESENQELRAKAATWPSTPIAVFSTEIEEDLMETTPTSQSQGSVTSDFGTSTSSNASTIEASFPVDKEFLTADAIGLKAVDRIARAIEMKDAASLPMDIHTAPLGLGTNQAVLVLPPRQSAQGETGTLICTVEPNDFREHALLPLFDPENPSVEPANEDYAVECLLSKHPEVIRAAVERSRIFGSSKEDMSRFNGRMLHEYGQPVTLTEPPVPEWIWNHTIALLAGHPSFLNAARDFMMQVDGNQTFGRWAPVVLSNLPQGESIFFHTRTATANSHNNDDDEIMPDGDNDRDYKPPQPKQEQPAVSHQQHTAPYQQNSGRVEHSQAPQEHKNSASLAPAPVSMTPAPFQPPTALRPQGRSATPTLPTIQEDDLEADNEPNSTSTTRPDNMSRRSLHSSFNSIMHSRPRRSDHFLSNKIKREANEQVGGTDDAYEFALAPPTPDSPMQSKPPSPAAVQDLKDQVAAAEPDLNFDAEVKHLKRHISGMSPRKRDDIQQALKNGDKELAKSLICNDNKRMNSSSNNGEDNRNAGFFVDLKGSDPRHADQTPSNEIEHHADQQNDSDDDFYGNERAANERKRMNKHGDKRYDEDAAVVAGPSRTANVGRVDWEAHPTAPEKLDDPVRLPEPYDDGNYVGKGKKPMRESAGRLSLGRDGVVGEPDDDADWDPYDKSYFKDKEDEYGPSQEPSNSYTPKGLGKFPMHKPAARSSRYRDANPLSTIEEEGEDGNDAGLAGGSPHDNGGEVSSSDSQSTFERDPIAAKYGDSFGYEPGSKPDRKPFLPFWKD